MHSTKLYQFWTLKLFWFGTVDLSLSRLTSVVQDSNAQYKAISVLDPQTVLVCYSGLVFVTTNECVDLSSSGLTSVVQDSNAQYKATVYQFWTLNLSWFVTVDLSSSRLTSVVQHSNVQYKAISVLDPQTVLVCYSGLVFVTTNECVDLSPLTSVLQHSNAQYKAISVWTLNLSWFVTVDLSSSGLTSVVQDSNAQYKAISVLDS
ncbi:hypothetical protein J6590_073877 [Homalodisca vitripennis]|nr:hypothetical protein J6590_073877 [Homalodisca vitripennis]